MTEGPSEPMPVETQLLVQQSFRERRPAPLNSLVASAQRLTSARVKNRRGFGKPEAWQEDAWDMYDLVGEQRFLATTLAGRLSQAKLYVGKVSKDPIEVPEPLDVDEHVAAQAFSYFGSTAAQRAQLIARLGVNLFVAGDGWLVGIPRHLLPETDPDSVDPDPMLSLDDLDWRMLSVSEVTSQNDRVTLLLGETKEDQIVCEPDDIFLIRVWRPHPRKWWQADSPTRSSLSVLRELVGLTLHISAQVDSRLAGAGILVVPASAKRAIAMAAGIDPDSDDDPFTEALMEAMLTPITDRGNASAMVPLVVTVPDESTGLFQHITFANALDAEARSLRDESIRRLALGQDAPPELLLGVGGMNHWGAWLVREDVVTTHLEPPLALICDAITTQFLWPVLIEQGMEDKEAREYVVWYDVSHMIQRPNRMGDANTLHEKGVLSDETLREAAGFTDEDAPPKMGRAVEIAVQMAIGNPALVDNMPEIIQAFDAVLNPLVATEIVAEAEDVIETGGDVTAEEAPVDQPDEPPADSPASDTDSEPTPVTTSVITPDTWSLIESMGLTPADLLAWAKTRVPKDADSDGFIDDGLPTMRPNPLDAQEWVEGTDEDRARLKVPKAWTSVEVNQAPGARLLAKGKDSKGRTQSLYSAEHTEGQAAIKFARLRALNELIPNLDVKIKEGVNSGDDSAKALSLIRKMGLRPGSESDTQAKVKAYGATNLLAEHVLIWKDGSVGLQFTGKKGVSINLSVDDPELVEMLTQQVKGKAPTDRLFDTNERKVNKWLDDAIGQPDFKVKDLRTHLANEIALNEISKVDPPTNMTGFRKQRKAVAIAVSAQLGNTPEMALASYINPAVFADWESDIQTGDFEMGLEDIGDALDSNWSKPLKVVKASDGTSGMPRSEEQMFMDGYLDDRAHYELSQHLRQGNPDDSLKSDQVKGLDSLIGRSATAEPTTLYRGMALKEPMSVGTEFKDLSYTSVTSDEEVARMFARLRATGSDPGLTPSAVRPIGGQEVVMEIRVPAEVHLASGDVDISERVLERGLTFRVVRVSQGRMIVEVVR